LRFAVTGQFNGQDLTLEIGAPKNFANPRTLEVWQALIVFSDNWLRNRPAIMVSETPGISSVNLDEDFWAGLRAINQEPYKMSRTKDTAQAHRDRHTEIEKMVKDGILAPEDSPIPDGFGGTAYWRWLVKQPDKLPAWAQEQYKVNGEIRW